MGCSPSKEAWELVDDEDEKIEKMEGSAPDETLGFLSVQYTKERYCLAPKHMRRLYEIYSEADTNGDGKLDLVEFCGWMKTDDSRKMGIDDLKLYIKCLFEDYDSRRKDILIRKLLFLRSKGVETEERHKQVANLSSKLGFAAFLYIVTKFCTSSERKLIDFGYSVFSGGPDEELTMGKFRSMCKRMHQVKQFELAIGKMHSEYGKDPDTLIPRKNWPTLTKGIPFLLWPVKNLQTIMRSKSLGYEEWSMIKKAALTREKKIRKKEKSKISNAEGGLDKQYKSTPIIASRGDISDLTEIKKVKESDLGLTAAAKWKKAKQNFLESQDFQNEKDWNQSLIASLQSVDFSPRRQDSKYKGTSFQKKSTPTLDAIDEANNNNARNDDQKHSRAMAVARMTSNKMRMLEKEDDMS